MSICKHKNGYVTETDGGFYCRFCLKQLAVKTKAEERLIKAVLTHFQCSGVGPTGCGSGICRARDAVRKERNKK